MLKNAAKDLKETIKLLPATVYLTWSDTKARYKRSVLGPAWLVLGTAIGVAGLGALWSTLLKVDRSTFIPSLTIGLIIWQLISGCVTESTSIYVRNASIVKNLNIPFLFFPLQLICRQLINFAHNLIVILVVLMIYPPKFTEAQFLLIPGFCLLIGNLFWISTLIGLIGARLRDLEPLIGSFMPLLFFITPVIYRPSSLGVNQKFVWLNPFSYLISLIRDPIQGVVPPYFVYYVSIIMLVVGGSITFLFMGRKYARFSFWV